MSEIDTALDDVEHAVAENDLARVSALLTPLPPSQIIDLMERLSVTRRAIVFRLLAKDRALSVFEGLDPALQGDLFSGLRDEDVVGMFAHLDPDDRVVLLDELPAKVTNRLLKSLPKAERDLTSVVLGYPQGAIGRRMSPEFASVHPDSTAQEALRRIHDRGAHAETVYTIPVVDSQRVLVGVVSLRTLLLADQDTLVADLASEPHYRTVTDETEASARFCVDQGLLALPIVDHEQRLVGILTIDDATRILEEEETEDAARTGGAEPLRRPYLSTSVINITKARVVWLLVLAVSAILTVQVLGIFESTLEEKVVLALFIPLLTGTGGNTGAQAATTITRALAMGDVKGRDVIRVVLREVRVGFMLGLLLGVLAFVVTVLVFDVPTALVISLTLLAICTMAATVGGAMPLLAKLIRADPAVFSTPFISTFCDAAGLIIYFSIAKAILQI